MFYYSEKILRVNLTTNNIKVTKIDSSTCKYFLGGIGLGIKILYEEVGTNIDALSPDNIVVFATGPLSGTSAPTNGRTEAVCKSPLTGIIGRGNFGGHWGYRLKRAGLEAIVIKGESDRPVYLWVDDGIIELRSAAHLWGRDTWETTDYLKRDLGDDVSVLSIGPAGENLVRFACPVADYNHAPGRSHAGCVMGAKKLKAIAVRGKNKVPIADTRRFQEVTKEIEARINEFPERGDRMKSGSYWMINEAAEAGVMPVGNFQSTVMPKDSEIWQVPDAVEKYITVKPNSYGNNCPLAKYYGCDMVTDIRDGVYKGLKVGGICFSYPAWEWGGKLGIKTFPAMWKCRELCQRYGMDQATPIPFALELFEKGIICKEDLDGFELKYGCEQVIMEMLEKIAYRKGFGDILAEGSERAARIIGKDADRYIMTIKGMEILQLDPRVSQRVMALGYVTCPRGGDDLNSTHGTYIDVFPGWARKAGFSEQDYLDWSVNFVDMFDDVKAKVFGSPPTIDSLRPDRIEGKAALVIWYENQVSIYDSLGLCMMSGGPWFVYGPTYYARLYAACTGWEVNPDEIIKAGERIFTLMKAYIVREGLAKKDDDWPARFYNEPIQNGPRKGAKISKDVMHGLLDEYYELRGWNKVTGLPTKKKLYELGLDYAADELNKMGRI